MFLDTSTVIELFIGSDKGERVLKTITKDDVFISILTHAEVAIWCKRNGKDFEVWRDMIEKIANTVDLTPAICYDAAKITFETKKNEKNFGIVDGIILASARSIDQRLMTKDKHFKGFEDAILI